MEPEPFNGTLEQSQASFFPLITPFKQQLKP
jgi:hypothetical protein